MAAVVDLAPRVGTAPACAALGLPRASWYRHARPAQAAASCASREDSVAPEQASPAPSRSHPRALDPSEQEAVLSVLHCERFVDKAPATVYATLLDEGTYLCSQRTMYRILEANSEVRERRDQLRHPSYAKPELVATAPNQVWSWDITKLRGPSKLEWFYLYVILDIFSRFVVGWMVARRETAHLAQRLIRETCIKQGIEPGSLAIHSDRGAPMVAQTVAQLLAALGVEKSHSRPHVSNDNPYSEAQFKTLKYCPEFPDRFGSLEDALTHCREFFPWYNFEHRHSGIGLMTPAMVHHGQAAEVTAARQATLRAAYRQHPDRFVHGPPRPPQLPKEVWINPPGPRVEGPPSTLNPMVQVSHSH